MKYYITKDNEDGTKETVWELNCTEDKALDEYLNVINQQCEEYHVKKTMEKWRIVRLFDENWNQIKQES